MTALGVPTTKEIQSIAGPPTSQPATWGRFSLGRMKMQVGEEAFNQGQSGKAELLIECDA